MNSAMIITTIAIVCSIPVFVRVFCILVKALPNTWPRWRHLVFTASAASVGTGAISAILYCAGIEIQTTSHFASLGLLCGLSGLILFDRRQRSIGG